MSERRIVVVTPWYPWPEQPFAGVFVHDTVRALGLSGPTPAVVHVNNVAPERVTPPSRTVVDGVEVLRIDVATPAEGISRSQMGVNQREALRRYAMDELSAADTVHAHVGIPAAWAVSGLLGRHQRLVVTEHASYLRRELNHARGRAMYAEVVARADALLTVSEVEAARIRSAFPHSRDKVVAWGNPVREIQLSSPHPVAEHLDNWLFVGRVAVQKGVFELLEAFALWREERPDATLTIVGDGPAFQDVEATVAQLGLETSVRLEGAKPADSIAEYFAAADALVHLSYLETFGLTVLEALLAELPVLVTRCGGPQETTAHAQLAGLVRTVKVQTAPERVVEALIELEGTSIVADRVEVRNNIIDRFGPTSYGARLRAVLEGGPAWEPIADDRPHLFAPTRSARAHKRVLALAPRALQTDIKLTVLTTQRSSLSALDPRVRIIDVSRTVAMHPLHLPERVLLFAIPERLLRGARSLLEMLTRSGGPGRIGHRLEVMITGLERRHARLARAVRHRVLERFVYSYLDPWLFAGAWEKVVLEQVDLTDIDAFVTTDNDARPLLWRLGRRKPEIPMIGVPDEQMLKGLTRRLR